MIANGTSSDYVIRQVLDGRKVGTFFTMVEEVGPSVENQAAGGTPHVLCSCMISLLIFIGQNQVIVLPWEVQGCIKISFNSDTVGDAQLLLLVQD